jgi:hypothetical protein
LFVYLKRFACFTPMNTSLFNSILPRVWAPILVTNTVAVTYTEMINCLAGQAILLRIANNQQPTRTTMGPELLGRELEAVITGTVLHPTNPAITKRENWDNHTWRNISLAHVVCRLHIPLRQ